MSLPLFKKLLMAGNGGGGGGGGGVEAAGIVRASFAKPLVGPTVDYTVPGIGTPKAIMIIANNSDITSAFMSIGYADGAKQNWFGISSEDNRDPTNTARVGRTDSCIGRSNPNATETPIWYFGFNSWITDGVRLNVLRAGGGAETLDVVFFYGDNIVDAEAFLHLDGSGPTPSSQTVSLGFEPDLVFMSSALNVDPSNFATTTIVTLGCAVNDGSNSQRCVSMRDADAQSPAQINNLYSETFISGVINVSTPPDTLFEVAVTGFSPSGFGIDITGSISRANRRYGGLALKFAEGVQTSLFTVNIPAASTSYVEATPGFEPTFGMLALLSNDAGAGALDNTSGGVLTATLIDDGGVVSTNFITEDGVSPSDCKTRYESKFFTTIDTGDVNINSADMAITSSGWSATFPSSAAEVAGWGIAIS